MNHQRELRILARLILDCLNAVEKRDPSVGIYYCHGKPQKGKVRK